MKTTQHQWQYDSPIGPLYLVASETHLQHLEWRPQPISFITSLEISRILKHTVEQLSQYFAGQRENFNLPLDAQGTAFQKRVWTELMRIPYGQTCSYKELAANVGNTKACRAVGTANGRNPISIIIPCHRVIAADGSLGGYGGGLPMKVKLLDLEQGEVRRAVPLSKNLELFS